MCQNHETAAATKIEYEREVCSRCLGTGEYSFNLRDGTRCYGCGGTGHKLTRRGKAARAYADTLLVRTVEEFAAMTGRVALYDLWVGAGIKKVEIGGARADDGERGVFVLLRRNGEELKVDGYNVRTGGGIKIRLRPSVEDIAEVVAYQGRLTAAGTLRKR